MDLSKITTKQIIWALVTVFFIIPTMFTVLMVSGTVLNLNGGKGVWFAAHIIGFFAIWLFFTYVYIRRVSLNAAVNTESGRYSMKKWFSASWKVISVLIAGFAFDYLLGLVLFTNMLSLLIAMGVILFLFRRPEGGIPQVNEGPVQADAMRPDDFRLQTRAGMDKYAGEAVRPPVVTPAAPRPPTATRPPVKDDQELS